MRLIDLDKVEAKIPGTWHRTAADALGAVAGLDQAGRPAAINDNRQVWGDLNQVLRDISAGKCWYCESKEIRSDKAVDHFRPKNRVAESKENEGYWWLAFDWRNYRYTCTYCNSRRKGKTTAGGKQDHFPLLDESTRGKPFASSRDLDRRERRTLIDPTDLRDVALLTFEINDGSVAPARRAADDPVAHQRALMSIRVYHLDEDQLQQARWERMREVREMIRVAEQLNPDDPVYKDTVARIASSIAPSAEYSAAARAMLKGLRGESPLAEFILSNA